MPLCDLGVCVCPPHVQEGGVPSGPVRVSIAPNPSHLEFIGPVVLGMVRAEQTRLQDRAKERVMGLLIHGDAAFVGLGVVAETFQLADTPGMYTCTHLSLPELARVNITAAIIIMYIHPTAVSLACDSNG